MKFIKRIALVAIFIVMAPVVVGISLKSLRSSVSPPGELIEIDGYALHINCVGDKNELPTVLFETGAGVSSPVYYWFQKEVSPVARICLYDRAGLGWSEESGLSRDAQTVTSTLHALLDKAGVERPFVYAGHSIAGLYMLYYAREYPDELAGLAFFDSSHPNQTELLQIETDASLEAVRGPLRMLRFLINFGVAELINPLSIGQSSNWVKAYPEEIQLQLKYLAKQSNFIDAYISELKGFDVAALQAADTKTLGDIPVVVVTASKELPEGYYPNGEDTAKMQAAIFDMHKNIASFSSNSEHFEIPSATHMSLVQDPENAKLASDYLIQLLSKLEKSAVRRDIERSGES